ncbi:MAG TPA: helix-turn-helix domain-containing protein [Candidatus Paceibacterota bacterium]
MLNISSKELEPLLELGLTKIQATIYLSLLKSGIMSVLEISKVTGINRQQVYQNSEILLKLGFVDITRKNNRKYIASNPQRLLRIGKQKILEAENVLENIRDSIPLLESITTEKNKGIMVKYYEGMKKIKEAYEEELENCDGTEVLSFAGSIDDIHKFFPESYWKKWNKKFVEQKSRSRMLVHKSEIARESSALDEEYHRQTRYLENFPLKVNVDVFNDITLIISCYDKTAVWIESMTIAESYRIMFETLWSNSKKF